MTLTHHEPVPAATGDPRLPVLQVDGGTLPAARIRELLDSAGAVLVRGLGLASPADLARAARDLGVTPMPEREGFTSRDDLGDGVHSASHWPADEPMCMHHERSYAAEVPGIAMFGCLTAPASGGATAISDAAAVLAALPAELVERFETHGWLLARSYRDVGVTLTEAFGTEDRAAVSAYCDAQAITHEWLPDGALHTRQLRAAVVRHPRTGARLWFNQAAFLNERTLDPVVREYLLSLYGPGSLPFSTYHGDGEPIDEQAIGVINEVYTAHTVREPWRAGDLLVLDNLRTAHSREAYQGEREVVALFGDRVRLDGHVPPGTPPRPAL
ncbi:MULTISPECIES: TauD/TfdA family dioxygenase [Streptomycetaceae]|uniref:SyrP-like protein n=1 Tax=Streptantibioticus cattleyicolor (strain ATCC 35852 / DSM 46488 / JCM 4925 / NBRC 14057 / NRRL 8057) TaxID=1003195 RepID=F8K3D4_STREN|nr:MULTISPECIES: TauD/TfdA family dioxygenase [Streptomycetaceae]AEW95048.1 SyrP-like protein [Streptantibioticus cattleyicolor NRRL 8057 = DSM 46488]MYS59645.1 TauD/TfdA family dioxygenase [Streptomyces sp. SID5468]CCB75398.1 SyrP-like protein [Streptantibioticus cattleyicolor NRRL 8057 = DSM 46488]